MGSVVSGCQISESKNVPIENFERKVFDSIHFISKAVLAHMNGNVGFPLTSLSEEHSLCGNMIS